VHWSRCRHVRGERLDSRSCAVAPDGDDDGAVVVRCASIGAHRNDPDALPSPENRHLK
jgi:hypothetical protein